jgi:hypothetical protein
MKKEPEQGDLFGDPPPPPSGTTIINERCRIHDCDGYRVVSVLGTPVAHYMVGDKAAEAYAMVCLVEQGSALQAEVASAFGCDVRTVRRNQLRAAEGGMTALGRSVGYPKGRTRTAFSRTRKVHEWKSQGLNNCQIAARLGITEKAIRKTLRRIGWKEAIPTQAELPFKNSDPNLSDSEIDSGADKAETCAGQPKESNSSKSQDPSNADPNMSGFDVSGEDAPFTLDTDPGDRRFDRLLAYLGAIEDAAPVFGSSAKVTGAGVLLAIPALLESGVFEAARDVYGSLGPAFYGLRNTILVLLLMALLRIKRLEGLKERCPRDFGRILGLDRAPEVKTMRTKLTRMSAVGRAASFGQDLARRRVSARGQAMGFLYVDGHVRVYHGKNPIPKTHVARMRICMPATTDYWVNDASGEPLFVVSSEANRGLASMLPPILEEVRALVGERRVTVVFDRGGWSPKLFEELIKAGFDILTYRKGKFRKIARKGFTKYEQVLDGNNIRYNLADQGVRLSSGLRLRQVTRLTDDGKQTPIITSRRDLSAIEVAYRMFSRWRQENFFKYLREEYALDALVEYETEPADPMREVPNPARAKIDSEIKQAQVKFNGLLARYGLEAFTNTESLRRTMRGFKIANAPAAKEVLETLKRITELKRKRAAIPARVPVCKARPDEVVKLSVERQHLTNLLKMVAFQAESELAKSIASLYRRSEDEGRTLIQNVLDQAGDIHVSGSELLVSIDPMSSPHRTKALQDLCEKLNATRTAFPGSQMRMRFEVKPSQPRSPAFPGPSSTKTG